MNAKDLLDKLQNRMLNRITTSYDDDFLIAELESAMYKVANKRWVDVEQLEDKYANAVINIALYNLALIGGDFENAHTENGITRSFITEQEILKEVTPKARVL